MNANGGPQIPEAQVQPTVTRQVTFTVAQVNVGNLSDGNRLLEIIDPGGATSYRVALSAEDARALGRELISTVPIAGAHEMPGNGHGSHPDRPAAA